MIIPGSQQAMQNIGKVVGMLDYVSKTETTNVMNNSFLVTLPQTPDGMESDMTMSNDMIKLTTSNDGKLSTFHNSLHELSTTNLVHDKKIQSLISTSLIQNYQSTKQQCNLNFMLPMALENDIETDSVEVIPQMASKRQDRKQKQNDQEEKDVHSQVLHTSSIELADAVLSGKQTEEE